MRQLAWISAPVETKRSGSQPKNRVAMNGEDWVVMPPVTHASHMVDWVMSELGPAHGGSMGVEALRFSDVIQWSQITTTPVEPWEARALVRASRAYVNEYSAAQKPAREAPYIDIEANRAAIAKQVARIF